jgi:UDP-N-acetylmuramoylalanine--D-glutamate ligase
MFAALTLILYKNFTLDEAIDKLQGFSGVAHRSELVANINGVKYYNDSAATIPQATMATASQFNLSKLHLIMGGSDKELVFNEIIPLLKNVKTLYLLEGNATDKILNLIKPLGINYNLFNSMQGAVDKAKSQATAGEVVLLSPAATSFGMFANEFDRGESFKRCLQ